jgi:2-(1,2-epoxy-1,2-dihydrophenyl)acetyl-CoA isomerase
VETLSVDRRDGVVTVTLNRPEKKNAMNLAMWRELIAVFGEVQDDPAARVLVLTGAGDGFCSGADLTDPGTATEMQSGIGGSLRQMRVVGRCALRLHELTVPTIAAVNGVAAGAGCNLALGCDLIVASDRAQFGEVFAKIGLVPDGGGTWLLSRLVGLSRAKELIFTADIIDAARAREIGLVNHVAPAADLERVTRALAERIAAGPPAILKMAKHLVNRGSTSDLAGALDGEASAQAIAITGEDHQEGLRAFFEKRPPRFAGR